MSIKTLAVRQVGTHNTRQVQAHNDYHAVAEVADCALNDVALPIYGLGMPERCYMPLDGTGRQWLVHEVVA